MLTNESPCHPWTNLGPHSCYCVPDFFSVRCWMLSECWSLKTGWKQPIQSSLKSMARGSMEDHLRVREATLLQHTLRVVHIYKISLWGLNQFKLIMDCRHLSAQQETRVSDIVLHRYLLVISFTDEGNRCFDCRCDFTDHCLNVLWWCFSDVLARNKIYQTWSYSVQWDGHILKVNYLEVFVVVFKVHSLNQLTVLWLQINLWSYFYNGLSLVSAICLQTSMYKSSHHVCTSTTVAQFNLRTLILVQPIK